MRACPRSVRRSVFAPDNNNAVGGEVLRTSRIRFDESKAHSLRFCFVALVNHWHPARLRASTTARSLSSHRARQATVTEPRVLAAFRPRGPYPILALFAEQGSGKSVAGRLIRGVFDPNSAALRSGPRDVRDLMIAAVNSWCLAIDNLSFVKPWLSDALCRLSTGGGFATRELFTDLDEIIFETQRPIDRKSVV